MTAGEFKRLKEELERLIAQHRKWNSETHSSGVADQFDDVLGMVKTMWLASENYEEVEEDWSDR